MYPTLLFLHSLIRWLVIISLIYAIYKAYNGYKTNQKFSYSDTLIRQWATTFTHIQLTIGIILYIQSPIIKYFWKNVPEAIQNFDVLFYTLIHPTLMTIGAIILTIGAALSKRKSTDKEKFKIMLIWFIIAFMVFLIAVPWPFSILSQRPYIRAL